MKGEQQTHSRAWLCTFVHIKNGLPGQAPRPLSGEGWSRAKTRFWMPKGDSKGDRFQRVCRATTRALVLSWCFLCSSGCSPVLADQALDDAGALDAGGHTGRLAGFVQRRSLFPRLVRPMLVVVPRILGQDLPEVPFAVD